MKYNRIILASKSPRRQFLLKEIGLNFEILVTDIDESYPTDLPLIDVAKYLSQLKANHAYHSLNDATCLVIASDTIVVLNNEILGKPIDKSDAYHMLQKLSGNMHQVVTGVTIKAEDLEVSFDTISNVYFRKLSHKEITYYVEQYQPFDKAGSYGIQEWIGYIAIEKVEGSFYNVMGLPIARLYDELKKLGLFPMFED